MEKMIGVSVKYIRLGGSGIHGRWFFTAEWNGSVYHIEHQPNSMISARYTVLKSGGYRLGEKISAEISQDVLDSFVGELEREVKKIGLYPKLRRDTDQLKDDMMGFASAIVLQNCHPEQEFVLKMEKRTAAYLESGLYSKSAKTAFQWSFGSNLEGWWWMREVPA